MYTFSCADVYHLTKQRQFFLDKGVESARVSPFVYPCVRISLSVEGREANSIALELCVDGKSVVANVAGSAVIFL